MPFLRIAMPTPLYRSFDYLPPADINPATLAALQPGMRVLAPFGPRKLVGVLLAITEHSDVPQKQLKAVEALLDSQPLLDDAMLRLCQWAASYYLHPLGDVLQQALPSYLRKPAVIPEPTETRWQLSTEGKGLPEGALKRAPKQAALLQLLQKEPSINQQQLLAQGLNKSHLRTLINKGLAEEISVNLAHSHQSRNTEALLPLNHQQQAALDSIQAIAGYQCALIDGITGSGKTEVYLQLISQCLKEGKQALVLIPEIGLSPQTLSRFQRRFDTPIALMHSALNDRERCVAWQQAASGHARVAIGTRSAIFSIMPELGLIIIDEEHDASYKQQDGFRYSARDLGIKRAFDAGIPIVLGSATPSLESLHNAQQGRYQHLRLTERAGKATSPSIELIDIKDQTLNNGFSQPLLDAIYQEIQQQNQILVFINRRGFAPVFMCNDCGFIAQCHHCDARLTVHYQDKKLRCHHCESKWSLPTVCAECKSHNIDFQGTGTERSEQILRYLFPDTDVIRIDRDTTSRKHAMSNMIEHIHQQQACILVGTQMLAKGHHFPNVTLVAMLDIDSGLFSADFRGPERTAQLLTQVAGRAGRAEKPGKVMLQTRQADHPFMQQLINNSYTEFAQQLITERQTLGLPPFSYLALVRADHTDLATAEQFLHDLRQQTEATKQAQCLGPLPAIMTRKAGRFRAQLILQARTRALLHQRLSQMLNIAAQHPLERKLRWSIDVDPIEAV